VFILEERKDGEKEKKKKKREKILLRNV